MEWIAGLTDVVVDFVRRNMVLTEIAVFAMGFAESIAFVSLFVPSTVLFLAIGGVHSAAGGVFWTVWLAGAAGAFLGDIVSYAFGRYFRSEIQGIWPFSRNADWYVLTLRFFQRWGVLSLIGGKFLGMMRPFIPVVAGAAQMGWIPFLLGSAISSLIWAGVFLAPGYGANLLLR